MKGALGVAVGVVAACAAAGALLGAIGGLFGSSRGEAGLLALAALGALAALVDSGFVRLPISLVRRQTIKRWRHSRTLARASILWGLDFGTGLTTVTHYALFWLVPAACVWLGEPSWGLVLYGTFGLGKVLGLWWEMAAAAGSDSGVTTRCRRLWLQGIRGRRSRSVLAVAILAGVVIPLVL